jgi:hypothetical protein
MQLVAMLNATLHRTCDINFRETAFLQADAPDSAAHIDALILSLRDAPGARSDSEFFEFQTILIGITGTSCKSCVATDKGWHGLAIPLG